MRKLIISERVTLDGIFDGDTMKEWCIPFDSEERRAYIIKTMDACDVILFGRTTYEWFPLTGLRSRTMRMGWQTKLTVYTSKWCLQN